MDHLVFVVHGIGAHYDLSFRGLVDCGKFLLKTTHLLVHPVTLEYYWHQYRFTDS